MRPTFTKALQLFALLTGALGLVLASAGAAQADSSNSQRAQQDASVTETNDTNDGGTPNNVVDDGDNKHPSGKDRSVENGKSGNQGKSPSDPDGTSNGGADKPGEAGGLDEVDQDGNNGCGNDDDFEDDNNGRCLGRDKAPGQQDEDTTPDENVDAGDGAAAGKVTLCHATGSATNPYVIITVSENAVITEGHDGHEGDVIPPIGDDYPGKNYDEKLIDAGCEVADTDTSTDVDGDGTGNTPGTGSGGDTTNTGGDTTNTGGTTGTNPTVTETEDVLGDVVTRTPANPAATPAITSRFPVPAANPAVEAAVATNSAEVLGSQVTRGQLARTGDETTMLVPFGLGLVLLGFGLQRTSKRMSAARIS